MHPAAPTWWEIPGAPEMAGVQSFPAPPTTPLRFYGLWLALAAGAFAVFNRQRDLVPVRFKFATVPLCAAMVASISVSACGGGKASKSKGRSGTPAGTYNLIATATNVSGSVTLTRNVSVSLTVK
jgi:hypothetical protein